MRQIDNVENEAVRGDLVNAEKDLGNTQYVAILKRVVLQEIANDLDLAREHLDLELLHGTDLTRHAHIELPQFRSDLLNLCALLLLRELRLAEDSLLPISALVGLGERGEEILLNEYVVERGNLTVLHDVPLGHLLGPFALESGKHHLTEGRHKPAEGLNLLPLGCLNVGELLFHGKDRREIAIDEQKALHLLVLSVII